MKDSRISFLRLGGEIRDRFSKNCPWSVDQNKAKIALK